MDFLQDIDLIDYISQIIDMIPVLLAEAYFCAWLHFDVLKKRSDVQLSRRSLIIFFVILYFIPTMLFFAFVSNTGWYYHIVNALIRIIPIVIFQVTVFKKELGKMLFLLLSLLAGIYTLKIAITMIYSYLSSLYLFVLEKIFLNIGYSNEQSASLIIQISCNVLMLLVDVVFIFLFRSYVHMISNAYIYKDEPLHFRESLFLVMPSATILTIVMTFRMIILLTSNDSAGIVFTRSNLTKIMLLVISFLMLGTIISDIKLFQQLILHHRDETQRLMLAEELDRMRKDTDELSDIYNEIRGLRHDMANHIANISALIHTNDFDVAEVDSYLQKMSGSMERIEFGYKTGNPISDIILSRKKAEAEKAGIKCEWDFSFPTGSGIDSYDIGVIIDNILSNAIQACPSISCQTRPLIVLNSRQKGGLFFIGCENPYQGEVLLEKETGEILPDHNEDAATHGFGLKNVRRIAQKYLGDIEITLSQSGSEKLFHIDILLNSLAMIQKGDDNEK